MSISAMAAAPLRNVRGRACPFESDQLAGPSAKATADFSPPRDAKSERAQKGPRSDHRSPEDARNSGAKALLPGSNEPHNWVEPAAAMGTSLNEPIGRNSPRARSSVNRSPAFLPAAKYATRCDSTQTAPNDSRPALRQSP